MAMVESENTNPAVAVLSDGINHNHAGAGMLQHVGGYLRHNDGQRPSFAFAELCFFTNHGGLPSGFPRIGRIVDPSQHSLSYFQRVRATWVPRPTVEWISNSLTSRLAPPNPRPNPVPVVNPSRMANSTSGIPGP